MIDMTNQILKSVVAHADNMIAKHKTNALVHCKNSVNVAEHTDHHETIQKELEMIGTLREDIKDVVRKHFSEYTEKSLLKRISLVVY